MITTVSGHSARARPRSAMPSMPGIFRSVTRTSTDFSWRIASALAPSAAVRVRYPACVRARPRLSRVGRSSSTTRMTCSIRSVGPGGSCVLLPRPPPPGLSSLTVPWRFVHGLSALLPQARGTETHEEDRASADPVLTGDAPPVHLDDALDDGKPEPEAVRLGRDEGEKDALPLRLRHARPAVRHGDVHALAGLTDRDLQGAPVRHGVQGVLPQVEEDLAE